MKTIQTGMLSRAAALVAPVDVKNRTCELSFASPAPVERYFGTEILTIAPHAIRTERIQAGGPLLVNHNRDDQVGVVRSITIDPAEHKARATVLFGQSARAQEIMQDVADGIRTGVSVGYVIHAMDESGPAASPTCTATDWEPLEISIVSIPADISVGVGRGAEAYQTKTVINRQITPKEPDMTTDTTPTAPVTEATPTVNLAQVREQAVSNEQARSREILAIGERNQMSEMAREFVNSSRSVDEFRQSVLAKLEQRGVLTPVSVGSDIGMSNGETKRYSLLRAIHALASPNDRKAQEAASLEFECSRAVAEKLHRTPQGFFVPMEAQQRGLVKGTPTAGGDLVATDLLSGSFVDLLRNRMMTLRMGASVLSGLVGDIAIPAQSGGATTYWVAESGAPTGSQQSFAQVGMVPNTVGALTDISRKLLLQSSVDVEGLVTRDLATVLALEIDRVALHGTGASGQPSGIAATTGIASVAGGTNGAAPTWANMIGLWSGIASKNADHGSLGFLTNASVIGKLMTTQVVATYGQYFIVNQFPDSTGMTSIAGQRCGVSNQVASNLTKGTSSGVCSAVFYGNWADLLIGQWGGLDIQVDPYTGGASGTVRVRVLQDVDVAVRHPESFAAMLDALTV